MSDSLTKYLNYFDKINILYIFNNELRNLRPDEDENSAWSWFNRIDAHTGQGIVKSQTKN